ncbi:hypothetical protein LSAT2_014845 [Lamellibrachia satsuma]|nr:hypothetical protein LSAT2_014845 [Lamellibrachia satsuma]
MASHDAAPTRHAENAFPYGMVASSRKAMSRCQILYNLCIGGAWTVLGIPPSSPNSRDSFRKKLVEWSNFIRDVCAQHIQINPVRIGGVGHTAVSATRRCRPHGGVCHTAVSATR